MTKKEIRALVRAEIERDNKRRLKSMRLIKPVKLTKCDFMKEAIGASKIIRTIQRDVKRLAKKVK